MKLIIYAFSFLISYSINEIIYEKVADSKYSNSELIKDFIVVAYNGGISKYSYNLKLITTIKLDDLVLNSYSDIHPLNDNTIIIESTRDIYLIENDKIKYRINFDFISYFRQVIIINDNNYLVVKIELSTFYLYFCIFNSESNIPIKSVKSNKPYNKFSCILSDLSNKKYIVCFLVDDEAIYYNIFDSNLNQVISDTKIIMFENNQKINYINSISIDGNKIILLINSIYDSPLRRLVIDDIIDKTFLQVFELSEKSGNFWIEKISSEEDFIIFDQIYLGINIFHMKKISDEEFVVVFPVKENKKEFYFSIFQNRDGILSIKESYKNIPLSFKYEIQGLKFLKIKSDFAISFYYLNNEEDVEIQEVFLSYLTTKNCKNIEILNYTNIEGIIDFSKYISLDLISPENDANRLKFDNSDSSSISFFYNNNPIKSNEFYDLEKLKYNTGDKTGIFDVYYSIFSANDYKNKTCKITFKILENDNEKHKENLEDEIKNKIEEFKLNFKLNSENNYIYESDLYKIMFYNTSSISINNLIQNKKISNIDLLFCEKLLKKFYNIPENEVFNIIQVELKREETISIQIEYEIYSQSFEKLNLDICKNEYIKINIPYNLKNIKNQNEKLLKEKEEINLEEKYKLGKKYNYDILNPNSDFYNEICTPFDSEYSTDLIIEDRKKYYYISQLFCEDNCRYHSYNLSNNKVICICYTKIEAKYNIIYRNFSSNILNSLFNKKISNVNFKVFKCIGKAFKNINKNIFIWIIILIFSIFCIFSYMAFVWENKNNNIKIVKIELGCELSIDDSSYKYNEFAIMPFDLANQYDKRDYFDIYIGTLKYNHIIWYTFILKDYSNNIFLKMIMFIFFIVLLILINLFLFSDKDFSNIYIKKGKYDFGNELPKSFSSLLICLLIYMLLRIFLSNKKNQEKVFDTINNTMSINGTNVEMNIKADKSNIKIIIFSIISFLSIVIIFFDLVSCGGIFINSQKYLLIRILYSLLFSFLNPFIFCFIYAFIRYLSLSLRIKFLYNLSLIIQNY